LIFSIVRDGKQMSVNTAAQKGIIPDEPNQYAVGISMDDTATLRLPIYLAVYEGAKFTWALMQEIVVGFGTIIAGLFHGTASVSDLTGPVGIAGMVNGHSPPHQSRFRQCRQPRRFRPPHGAHGLCDVSGCCETI
jgi:hypothetical protein